MSLLPIVISRVLAREGATFVNQPGDKGGPTRFGITVAFYSSVTGRPKTAEDVQRLDAAAARTLYLDWLLLHRCDEIDDLAVLDAFVDYAVHSGMGTAIKALQRALDVSSDGVIGPITLAALKEADAPTVVKWLTGARLRKIGAILSSDPSQAKWAKGWMNRIADVLEAT